MTVVCCRKVGDPALISEIRYRERRKMKDLKAFSNTCRKFGGIVPPKIYPADKANKGMVLLVSGDLTNKDTAKNAELFAKLLLKTDRMPVFLAILDGAADKGNEQSFPIKDFPVLTVPRKRIRELILQSADLFELTVICSAYDAFLVSMLNGEKIPVLWMTCGMDEMSVWNQLKSIPIFKCRNISVASLEAEEKKVLLKHRPFFRFSGIAECALAGADPEAAIARLVENAKKTVCRAGSRAVLKIERPLFRMLERNRSLFSRSRLLLRLWRGVRGVDAVRPAMQSGPLTYWDLYRQHTALLPMKVKFSIVVPLYNTPPDFLREMIGSVQKQTYTNWELCLADGSDTAHDAVRICCMQAAEADKRIRYRHLTKNLGISGNTNAALEMSTGDHIALLDHDDILHPSALYEAARAIDSRGADLIYTDEAVFQSPDIHSIRAVHCKPDHAPDSLRGNNYICHFTVFKKALLDEVGLFRPEYDGSQDYDMILRLTEKAKMIVHIPKILYYWRVHPNSTAYDIGAKSYAIEAGRRALGDHLARIGLKGEVTSLIAAGAYRIRYELNGTPKVSVLIPSKDHADDLSKCIGSLIKKTTYPNWEIVIIDNGSTQPEVFSFYDRITKDARIRVVTWNEDFNYPKINNYGAGFAGGEYLILLNNDTQIITPEWIEEMLMFAQRGDVGAVGAKLYYPNETVQHAGVCVGIGGYAGHYFRHAERSSFGYMGRLAYAQDLSAVTAACMMIPRSVWDRLNGLDPEYTVAVNDVDLCLRIREAGYLIVWTPFAELYHYESKSRGRDDIGQNQERFQREVAMFRKRWGEELNRGDPYFNPNFSPDYEDFTILSPDEVRRKMEERDRQAQDG